MGKLTQAAFEAQVRRFGALRPNYKAMAERLNEVLREETRDQWPLAIVQARAKATDSFAKKIKVRAKYTDPLNQMNDLVGGRIILHSEGDIAGVSDRIRRRFVIDELDSQDVVERLGTSEFGYRSVHFTVSFREGDAPATAKDVPNAKMELQVRTFLQHAWADVVHDTLYKAKVRVPARWHREAARIGALLESAQRALDALASGVAEYETSYLMRKPADELREQAEDLLAVIPVLSDARAQARVRRNVGRLQMAGRDWTLAEATYRTLPDAWQERPEIKAELGEAAYEAARRAGDREAMDAAERLLLSAADGIQSARPWCVLGELTQRQGGDSETLGKAQGYFEEALKVSEGDPRAVWGYCVTRLRRDRSSGFTIPMRATLRQAARTCMAWAEAEVYVPRAHFDLAAFRILLGETDGAMEALTRGLVSVREDISLLPHVRKRLEWFRTLHALPGSVGAAWRLPYLALLGAHEALKPGSGGEELVGNSRAIERPAGPVVLIAGGCDASAPARQERYLATLLAAFDGFQGLIVSGGTSSGAAGMAAMLATHAGSGCRALGYTPASPLPDDAALHPEYDEQRSTDGQEFSELEPIQAWLDLMASGVRPEDVRLIGMDGGTISAFEYRFGLALGASVALMEGGGRAARELLRDRFWGTREPLMELPTSDAQLARAFVGRATSAWLAEPDRESAASAVHERYRVFRGLPENREAEDEAWRSWDELPEPYRRSNRDQVDHFPLLLAEAGVRVRRAEGEPRPPRLTKEQLRKMASLEHARWMVQKALAGWRYGPVKSSEKKTHPDMVPWDRLPADQRERDLDPVTHIAAHLSTLGLEVVEDP